MITKLILSLALILAALASPSFAAEQRIVYVVNHADSRFPVAASIKDWNPAPRAEFVYTKTCNGKRYCLDVYHANLKKGYAGVTKIYRFQDGTIKYRIYLDTDPRSTHKRRSIVCHELGHAFEIGHNGRGCMTNSSRSYPQYPGRYNLNIAR